MPLSDEYINEIEMLQEQLNKEYEEQLKKALEEMFTTVADWPRELTVSEDEMAALESDAKKYLGAVAIMAAMLWTQTKSTDDLFRLGMKEAVGSTAMTNLTYDYLDDLISSNSFWIGQSWDIHTKEKISAILEKMLGEKLNRTQIAEILADSFKDMAEKSTAYWNMLADHMAVKTHEIGQVSGFITKNIKYARVVVTMDNRTTPFCKSIYRWKIPVSSLKNQVEGYFRAVETGDKETISSVWPMHDPNRAYRGKPENLGTPPYHYYCRTKLRVL